MIILQCVRKGEITYLTVDGQVSESDKGRSIVIEGVSDISVDGTHTVLAAIPPYTIRIAQAGLIDIPAGLKGGSLVFASPASPAKPATLPTTPSGPPHATQPIWHPSQPAKPAKPIVTPTPTPH